MSAVDSRSRLLIPVCCSYVSPAPPPFGDIYIPGSHLSDWQIVTPLPLGASLMSAQFSSRILCGFDPDHSYECTDNFSLPNSLFFHYICLIIPASGAAAELLWPIEDWRCQPLSRIQEWASVIQETSSQSFHLSSTVFSRCVFTFAANFKSEE